jgi:hypothetical protein
MRIVKTLALVVFAACQSAPASKPAANLEQLIRRCQEQTGSNFTYSAETGALLRAHGLKLAASDPHTAQAWFEVLRGVLEAQELELVRVGPEHLGVWLVRPVAKSG